MMGCDDFLSGSKFTRRPQLNLLVSSVHILVQWVTLVMNHWQDAILVKCKESQRKADKQKEVPGSSQGQSVVPCWY